MTARNDAFIDFIGIGYGKVPSLLLRTTIESPARPEKSIQSRALFWGVPFARSDDLADMAALYSTQVSTFIAELAQWLFHEVANALTNCFEDWLAAPVYGYF